MTEDPGCLISSIKTVCQFRKCSFLTDLITLLTDLLKAYHQGRKKKGTSKTKSSGFLVPPRSLCSLNFFVSRSPTVNFFPVLHLQHHRLTNTFSLTLKMTSTQVVKTSVSYNSHGSYQNCPHPDDWQSHKRN